MKSFRLRFRPEARLELEAAADWYEENSPGLGAEFVADAAALFTVPANSLSASPSIVTPFIAPECAASPIMFTSRSSPILLKSWR